MFSTFFGKNVNLYVRPNFPSIISSCYSKAQKRNHVVLRFDEWYRFLQEPTLFNTTMNTEEIKQSAVDDFLAIVKVVSVWGIKHKFGSNVDRAFQALFTGDYQEVDHFNFAFEIPRSILDSIFQKRDSETKQTVHLNYGTIIPELEVKGQIVRFKNGGFMQNKKHPCSRYLLNKDELKKIFADGNEIKKILRYWTEDSIYTIRQQKLLLKLITRKKQMTDNTEQDTPVFINEAKMKIERNRRLGRAKAKRTKIQELTENVEQLTKLVTMLVANQGIQQEAPKQVEQPKPVVDNSDIPEEDEEEESDELTPEQKAYADKILNDPCEGWQSEEEILDEVKKCELAIKDLRNQEQEEVMDYINPDCVKEEPKLTEQDQMLNKMSFKKRAEWAKKNLFAKV